MKELNLKDLIKYKKLPFNIYNEKGQIIMYTGDLLTPGKVLELKESKFLIYDENFEKKSLEERENPLVMKRKLAQQEARKKAFEINKIHEDGLNENENETNNEEVKELEKTLQNFNSIQDLRINQKSVFSPKIQLQLRDLYTKTLLTIKNENYTTARNEIIALTDKIEAELTNKIQNIRYISQLKFLGERQICHGLNVGIISGFIVKINPQFKLDAKDLILSGLLHDIGKIRFDEALANRTSFYNQKEQSEYEKHVVTGYKIIREKFNFGNRIAKPALEHHVFLDGTGYPKGISLDNISDASKIIAVVNYYDDLTSNRTSQNITYNYEAGKIMLSQGAKKYSINLIYDISNKYILNDTSKLSELIN